MFSANNTVCVATSCSCAAACSTLLKESLDELLTCGHELVLVLRDEALVAQALARLTSRFKPYSFNNIADGSILLLLDDDDEDMTLQHARQTAERLRYQSKRSEEARRRAQNASAETVTEVGKVEEMLVRQQQEHGDCDDYVSWHD